MVEKRVNKALWMMCLPALLASGFAFDAQAARVTDVADAVDGDDPIDVNIQLRYDFFRHTALVTREHTQPDDLNRVRSLRVREMAFERMRHRLIPRVEVGIFHDLAAFAELPIVFFDRRTMGFAPSEGANEATSRDNSTLARDQLANPPQTIDGWSETAGTGTSEGADGAYGYPAGNYNAWDFDLDNSGAFTSQRAGVDNPSFGLRYSPVNNERDESKPTITLQGDYTAPVLQTMRPDDAAADPATVDQPGYVANGAHQFHFQVGMSKRWTVVDPYFLVDYHLPFGGSSSIPGFLPQQNGGFTLGLEIVPYENKSLEQRFALDFFAGATYFAEGRDYTEVVDAFNDLTYLDQFMRVKGGVGLFFKAAPFVTFNVEGNLLYDTDHLLTQEDIGKDENGNGVVDLDVNAGERNPYYNPLLDTPGRRLRVEESLAFQVIVRAALTF